MKTRDITTDLTWKLAAILEGCKRVEPIIDSYHERMGRDTETIMKKSTEKVIGGPMPRLVSPLLDLPETRRVRKIMQGLAAVHAANVSQMVPDRGGDLPRCKPGLGPGAACVRCGGRVPSKGACPSVPLSKRWHMSFPPNDKTQAPT